MDLGICPRCGKQWPGGEICPHCGFIPIGAGLSRLPKKKRKKIKPYREPGSATPFLLCLAILGGVGSVWQSKPWEDGWDRVRALFGHARIHDITGNWEVTRVIDIDRNTAGPLVAARIDQATIEFSPSAAVIFKMDRLGHELQATGSYDVDGTLVHIRNLHTDDDGGPPLPRNMDLPLAWSGEDEVTTVTAPQEEAELQRETGTDLVALRADQVTGSYQNNEEDAHSLLTRQEGGQ